MASVDSFGAADRIAARILQEWRAQLVRAGPALLPKLSLLARAGVEKSLDTARKSACATLDGANIMGTPMKAIARLALVFCVPCALALAQNLARVYPVKPVPFIAVHVTDRFWAPKIETNRIVTIPFAF